MKVVRVMHSRHGRLDESTLFLAPPEVTNNEQLQGCVDKAVKGYLDAIKEACKLEPAPEILELGACPEDVTVGEAKRLVKESKEHYSEWNQRIQGLTKDFCHQMQLLGFKSIKEATEEELPSVTAKWEHEAVVIDRENKRF